MNIAWKCKTVKMDCPKEVWRRDTTAKHMMTASIHCQTPNR